MFVCARARPFRGVLLTIACVASLFATQAVGTATAGTATAGTAMARTAAARTAAANTATSRSSRRSATAHAAKISQSLHSAARTDRQADRALVTSARATGACLIAHPHGCTGDKRLVQRAGEQLTADERRLAQIVDGGVSDGARAATAAVPVLSVHGQTLRWTSVPRVKTYIGVRHIPGRGREYAVIEGTSFTPPPVLGSTVSYSVRAAVNGSAWAAPVSITYSSQTVNTKAAPKLTVSGQTLSWSRVGNVKTYVSVRKAPGQEYQFEVVNGTSTTPPAVPDASVLYSARTNVEGSTWAAPVTISYPAATPAAEELSEAPAEQVIEKPAEKPTEKPAEKPPTEKPVEKPAEQPIEKPAEKPTEKPAEQPPAEQPTEQPAEKPAEQPAEQPPTEKPVEKPAEQPTSGTGEGPGGQPPSEPSSAGQGELGGPFVKGINANLAGWGVNNTPAIASEMSSLGVNWEREALDWSEAEPQKGVFDWSSFDQVVTEANANHITLLPIVGYAPSWASPGDSADYAAFVAAAVARYGPGTTANLKWWELWNEPYFAYAWSGHTPEPEAYGRDVLAAAEAAKHVSPSVKLLIAADYQEAAQTGGSSPEEKTWINDMFTAAPTLGKWIDGVSVHPYGGDPSLPLKETGGYLDTSGQWGFQRIDTIREKFLAHGMNVPFWITEEGWSTWENSETAVAHNYADLITQIKTRPWIRALFPFGLREGTEHPTNNQAGFALLKFGTWQPKEAWGVLQEGFKTLD
jgi:hypothetical protein